MSSRVGLFVLVVAVAVFGYGLFRTWGPDTGGAAKTEPKTEPKTQPAKGNLSVAASKSAAEKPAPAKAKTPDDDDPKPRVRLTTTHGEIVVELDRTKAPITVENFLRYCADGHYDDTIFHRVVKGFVVQGGHFTEDDQKSNVRATIKNEASNGLSNESGTIAMARSADPDSATDQFYFNVADNKSLDPVDVDRPGYTVFGRIIEGLETVIRISEATTVNQGGAFTSIPSKSVILQTAKRE